ncbi:MAG: aldo/keto reductase, partial [Geodermatophilaceae bacterium]
DAIGLYQLHRPDPDVDYADSLGAMRELYDAGKVRMVGISNATLDQIEQARQVVGEALVSVQNQFSPRFRSSADELRYCDEHGLAFLPWSPLGGIGNAAELGSSYAAFAELAEDRGVSPQQVCLAWLLAQGRHVVPIPGSSRPETVTDSARAGELRLTEEELSRLDAA